VAASEALTKLDQVLCANLNQTSVIDVLKDFDKASFDYIVCADVLEHLIDPWKVLAELVTYLKPNGRFVTSIPNVRHWSVWLPLILRGHWEYREAGIMDSTHLRFFTRRSAAALLNGAGLNILVYQKLIGGKWRILDKFSIGLLTEFISIQLVFVGVKKNEDEQL
jgi:O-antigen biosynthesis protein